MKNAPKLLLISFLLMAIGCKNETQNDTAVAAENTGSAEISVEAKPATPKSLNQVTAKEAFELKPSEIYCKDSVPKNKEVYAVIVDWTLSSNKNSLVAFKSGEASILLNGIDIQFEMNPQSFNSLSTSLIEKAEKALSSCTPATERTEPAQNQVKVYVLTADGKYVYENKINEFKKNKEMYDVFETATNLLLQSRKAL
ncbi:hypothetical protein SAMN06265349_102955 [Flavobacterium resistens]|uniref:Uncharacterized protein n=1 Tax=Flavobacterium resistens TaxID=443612 RepID=A0A521CVM7_9FLAO|nr:hypothetical protein [Flavobacterium resistens]MRX67023.1 hypothetical protein [Flavobacterium resistens]SMO63475.1 hypothetical protein SAMN06265349_102955 [Flavobacterium resistens]